jgi:membrane protein
MSQTTQERQETVVEEPAKRRGTGRWAALRRTVREVRQDGLTDCAAALTYYGMLALFPALLVVVSIVGLVGSSATQPLLNNLSDMAPGPVRDILTTAVQNLEANQSTSGVLLAVGLAGSLWAASGYVGAFMRASNRIYDVPEGRPVWKTVPTRVLTTLGLLVMLVAVTTGAALTGGFARRAGDAFGVGSETVDIWEVAKWPVMLILVMSMFAILYWAAPNVKHPFRLLSPGAVMGVLLCLLASTGLAAYVASFGSYNATYGALGGVVVFLVWLWVANMAILLGAELNAELERGRRIAEGQRADVEPFLEPRDTRKQDRIARRRGKHAPAASGGW